MRDKVRKYIRIRLDQGFKLADIRARLARRDIPGDLVEESIRWVQDEIRKGVPAEVGPAETLSSASIRTPPAAKLRQVSVAKPFIVIGEDGHSEIQDVWVDEEVAEGLDGEEPPAHSAPVDTDPHPPLAPRVDLPPPAPPRPVTPQFYALRIFTRLLLLGVLALHGWRVWVSVSR